jgi:hypothetical protein
MVILGVGSKLIDDVDGRDVKRWFNAWAGPKIPGDPMQIPKARTAIAVIKSALNFGIMCRKRGCAEFKAVLVEVNLPVQASRTTAPTADDITKVRSAAREAGHGPAALAYAIQFDGAARQWDVIGEWVPMSDPRPSIVLDRGMKWVGPMWSQIDENQVFWFTPSKTENTTGKEVAVDFTVCPMIMEELTRIPTDQRKGPLIVNPVTGKPYRPDYFQKLWRSARDSQGASQAIWNRDLRAEGITEGRACQCID